MMRDKKRFWASQMRSRLGVTRRSEGRVDCFEGKISIGILLHFSSFV